METVGSIEAKTHLPALLERAANGETIVITKHGREVARLVPPESAASRRWEEFAPLSGLRDLGILGAWADRDDIGDSAEFARQLRLGGVPFG